jgi:prephenate dehydratase
MTKTTIAFGGAVGSYADLATRALFPDGTPLPCPDFADACAAVKNGLADRAVIPIENAIVGRVAEIHHLLPASSLCIVGEHYQPVIHHLLAPAGVKLSEIRQVTSHPQALSQCRNFLRKHNLKPVATGNTAQAARDCAQSQNRETGVIASALAGELYGLESLAADVADQAGNTTRFLVMGREACTVAPTEDCITSMIFRVRSLPSALYKALGGFATNGINITKLESYLVDGDFSAAQFYLDAEGHPESPPMHRALEELRFFVHQVTMLGTYPAHPFRRKTSAKSA